MADLQWLIGGEAGYGIMTSGLMMSKIFTRLGLSVFDYVEYPSLIRGGHNAYYVRGSDTKIYSQRRGVDILIALNRDSIDKHKHELSVQSVVIFDPQVTKILPEDFSSSVKSIPIPFLELIQKTGADRLMVNTVATGASLALLYENFDVVQELMTDVFRKKGEKVIQENIHTSKAGFEYVRSNFPQVFNRKIVKKTHNNVLIGGTDAISLGAIKAGVQFAAIYPMTPINGIMVNLVSQAKNFQIVTKEPEDEIAGINMALGASFAGVRSLVATSGGGFSLMVESVGLSSQTETPLVIVEGMRPGPATGMPTWTGQGDVRFVLHAAQDDFPRIVLAPGDMQEAIGYTMEAFNLAEKYQMPVVVLVDKYLNEGHTSVSLDEIQQLLSTFKIERGKMLTDAEVSLQTDYKRYAFTDDGISPRSIPGQQGGIGLSGSDEHDEHGLYNEESENRIKMMNKRFKKLDFAAANLQKTTDFYGDVHAKVTLVAFGSTKMPILEAMEWLKKEGITVGFLKINCLHPFPTEAVEVILKNVSRTLIIEGNKTGQLEGLIKEHTGITLHYNFRKYDGRPFYPEEIVEKVKKIS